MGNCSIENKGLGSLYNKLLSKTMNNPDEAAKYLATVTSKDFQMWYSANTGKSVNLTDMRSITDNFVKQLNTYIGLSDFAVNRFKQNYTKGRTILFGDNTEKIEHAVDILATMFLKGENSLKSFKEVVSAKTIKEEMLFRIAPHLANSTGVDIKNQDDATLDAIDGFNPMFTPIEDIRNNLKNSTLTEDQVEFCLEVITNIHDNGDFGDNSLFELVIRHPRVNQLSKEFGLFKDMDDSSVLEETSEEIQEVYDGMYDQLRTDWSNMADQNPDISKKVSKAVKEIFELTFESKHIEGVDGNVEYNNATYSGIPVSINFGDYYKTIMNHADFSNADSFVKSLYEIAERFPNRSSLKVIADKLNDSSIEQANLKFKIYTQFNQHHIKRERLNYGVHGIKVGTSNRTSFARLVMLDRAISSFDNLIEAPINIQTNAVIINEILNDVKVLGSKIKADVKANLILRNKEKIITLFNNLNLPVDNSGIENYIKYNSSDVVTNINNLATLLKEINSGIISTIPLVEANNGFIKEWYRINHNPSAKKYRDGRIEEVILETVNPFGVIHEDLASKDKKRLATLISEYEANVQAINNIRNKIANKIPNYFENYQLINFEYNSINVEGNLVADIIKPSYLKRFFDRLQDNNATIEYFTKFANSSNYKKGNFVVEQRDDKGKVIIPGMLREVLNEKGEVTGYTTTPYYKMFEVNLFDGAKNDVFGNNKTYSKMTQTEWNITALNEYLNNNDVDYESGLALAKYFIQTPSDAPKTFSISSYKLKIDGLINDGQINRSHPIHVALTNILTKEIDRAANAMVYLFETETTDNGDIVLKREKRKLGGVSKPIVKKEFTNAKESTAKKNYHYKKSILDKNGKPTGNVFKFEALNLTNKKDSEYNPNSLQADGVVISDFLYGGSGNQSIVIRETSNGVRAILTDNQKEAIATYIDKYITATRNQTTSEYSKYIDFVEGFNTENTEEFNSFVHEFDLNYTIQYDNFNDMLFGDSKMYKDGRDTIKRNKEVIAGGLLYGSYSLTDNPSDRHRSLTEVTIGNKVIKVTPSFEYVTLDEVSRPVSTLAEITKQLDEANTPEDIKADILSRFGRDTDISDAQSWITLDELTKRVVLMGEYDLYKDTLEALYDESKPVDFTKLSKLLQVQKNFYYEMKFDEAMGMAVPTQTKNAEYVLIPRFLGNTELGLLAKIMNDNGIGQVNMSSTEKATSDRLLNFWNSDGSFDEKVAANFTKQVKKESFRKVGYYSNLYKQQDVPQHMDSENKAGIQIIKKILDNISDFKGGEQLKEDFFGCYNANIRDSFTGLLDRLGFKVDKVGVAYNNGVLEFNNKAFYDMLKDELTRRGVDTNMISYVELDSNGQPQMPLDLPTVRSKMESVIQAIFTNNITSQKLPGFHASQVSTLGLRKLSNEKLKTLSYEEAEASGYNLGRELQYHPDGKNYMEVILPHHMKELYDKYDEEGNLISSFTAEDLAKARLDKMIGYRIPTEGKQSIVVMKVVGFLNPSQGSTIVVPDGFVTQTGSDFDIDSVYGIYHSAKVVNGEIKKAKFIDGMSSDDIYGRYLNYVRRELGHDSLSNLSEESKLDLDRVKQIYKDTKEALKKEFGFVFDLDNEARATISAEKRANFESKLQTLISSNNLLSLDEFTSLDVYAQNTKDARNNKLVDTFISIMEMKENTEENLMSSNFDDIARDKRVVFGEVETFRNINRFKAQSDYRATNMDGAQLKAISVKRDTFCSICNVSKASVISSDRGILLTYPYPKGEEAKEEFINRLIACNGKDNVVLTKTGAVVNHNKIGWSLNGNRNAQNKLITVYSSETTALILDGVKEGGVPNVNLYTFDVYKTFADMGCDYLTAIRFINQPAILRCTEVNNNKGNIFDSVNGNELFIVERELLALAGAKYNLKFKKGDPIKFMRTALNKAIGSPLYTGNTAIELKELQKNINKTLEEVDPLEQLQYLYAFRHYKNIAAQINNHSNVLNTDKVGAGQSINHSIKLVNDINKIKTYNENVDYGREKPVSLRSNGQALIDAVYPFTEFETINDIMEDNTYSVYSSLYQQLKYGVIASNMITRNLFKTHTDRFEQSVAITDDIKDKEDFTNYKIAHALNNTSFVKANSYITKEVQGFPNYNINITSNEYDNRKRLFGFETAIVTDFNFTDYSVENVERFMKLSPARKVMLLQSYTTDSNIFKELKVNLKDKRLIDTGKGSKQTITILDTTINQERLYKLFKDAYYNNNPFIQLAAKDIIRYAIAVEGFRFFGGSVSKIVPTELLLNPLTGVDNKAGISQGTGIINEFNKLIENSEVDVVDYVKSNPDSKLITKVVNTARRKITFTGNGMAELSLEQASTLGLVKIVDDRPSIIKSFVITNPSIEKKSKTITNLYTVVASNDKYYLIPLNTLEKNEIGSESVNADNKKFASENIYKAMLMNNANLKNIGNIDKAIHNVRRNYVYSTDIDTVSELFAEAYPDRVIHNLDTGFTRKGDKSKNILIIASSNKLNEVAELLSKLENKGITNYTLVTNSASNSIRTTMNELNRRDIKEARKELLNKSFETNRTTVVTHDSNGETGTFKQFKSVVASTLDSNSPRKGNESYIAVSSATISNLKFNPNTFFDFKLDNGTEVVATYFGQVNRDNIKLIPDYNKITAVERAEGIVDINYPFKEYLEEVVNNGLRTSRIVNLVKVQTKEQFENNQDLNSILTDNDEALENYLSSLIAGVQRSSEVSNNSDIKDAITSLRNLGLTNGNTSVFNDILREQSLNVMASFIEARTEYFKQVSKDFFNGHSINDNALYNAMITDEDLNNEYLQFVNSIRRFIDDNKYISSLEKYDIEEATRNGATASELADLKRINSVITKLQSKLIVLSNLDRNIEKASKKYIDIVVSQYSTNPMIKDGTIKLSDVIEDTSGLQYLVGNIESSNVPLVNIAVKEIISKIDMARYKAKEDVETFKTKVESIIAEARKSGKNISYNDILDENGKFILSYTSEFLSERNKLRDNIKFAELEFGKYSAEYRNAEDDFNNFMVDNIEQVYTKKYYKARIKLNKHLAAYPYTLNTILKLEAERRDIETTIIDNDRSSLTPENKKRLAVIEDIINDMRSIVDNEGNYKSNLNEIKAIDSFFEARKKFYEKYNEFTPSEAFTNKLKIMQDQLSYPEDSIEYKEAKEWLAANTRKVFEDDFASELRGAFLALKTSSVDDNSVLRTLSLGKRDTKGVIDGTKFTDKQIASIKREQELQYSANNSSQNIRLLRPGKNDKVYIPQFYNSMTTNKSQSKEVREAVSKANSILRKVYDSNEGVFDTSKLSQVELLELVNAYNIINGKDIRLQGDDIILGGGTDSTASKKVAQFIEENVIFEYDYVNFNTQKELAKSRGEAYYRKWITANTEVIHDSDYYRTLSETALSIFKNLGHFNDKRNIIKAIRFNDALRGNRDKVNELPELAYFMDMLSNKSYNHPNGRTLAELLQGDNSEAKLNEVIKEIAELPKSDSLKYQLDAIKSDIVIAYSQEYVDVLEDVGISTKDRLKSEWFLDNHTINDKGEIVPLGELLEVKVRNTISEVVPNRYLYGTIQTNDADFLDVEKTKAKAFLKDNVTFKNTPYYMEKYKEMKLKGDVEFNTWFDANHIYNPYEDKFEPLRIWQEMTADESKYKYIPNRGWTNSSVKAEFENPNYVKDEITLSSDTYKNSAYYNMDSHVRQMYDLTKNYFDNNVKDKKSKNYLKYGNFPSLAIDKKRTVGESIGHFIGWYDKPNTSDKVSNMNQRYVNAPTLHHVSDLKLIAPRKKNTTETNAEYVEYLKQVKAENEIIRAKQLEDEKNLNDTDALKRMINFIDKINSHNAALDINNFGSLISNYLKNAEYSERNTRGKIVKDRILSRVIGKDKVQTSSKSEPYIAKQFDDLIKKVVYNENENDYGLKSKVSRLGRNLVSTRMMYLNITSGIANVMYGESQVAMEMAAGTHFDKTHLAKAIWEYKNGIGSYFRDYDKATSSNETNAIIRLMDVLDEKAMLELYNDATGVGKLINDAGYLPNTMGEHFMQNTVMLAMLRSHKLVYVDGKHRIMSFDEYTNKLREDTLIEVLTDFDANNGTNYVNEFKIAKAKIANSDIMKEDFIKYNKDLIAEYVRVKNSNIQKAFILKVKDNTAKARETFDSLEDVRSQFEFKDGKSSIKADSNLTLKELSYFKQSIKSVNHHIHGVYDKIGANTLQRHWLGALAMQFHKHIVPGIQKRFGYHLGTHDGIYSESRHTVNKGSYTSLAQYVLNIVRDGYKFNSNEELIAYENLGGTLNSITDFVNNAKLHYNTLPKYEQANIRRCASEIGSVLVAYLLYIAGGLLLDDDEESTQVADYVLYTADRLNKETLQYSFNMYGAIQELYQNPFPFMAFIKDIGNISNVISEYVITGDSSALYFKSGANYGENRIGYRIQKMIPVWNQWLKHENLGSNNRYFKVY